jgi:Protein kinase domain
MTAQRRTTPGRERVARRARRGGGQAAARCAGGSARGGVLHRDVKPSNVLLCPGGRTVLTDFGIATAEGDPSLTQAGVVMGSPGFLAPERIRGGGGGTPPPTCGLSVPSCTPPWRGTAPTIARRRADDDGRGGNRGPVAPASASPLSWTDPRRPSRHLGPGRARRHPRNRLIRAPSRRRFEPRWTHRSGARHRCARGGRGSRPRRLRTRPADHPQRQSPSAGADADGPAASLIIGGLWPITGRQWGEQTMGGPRDRLGGTFDVGPCGPAAEA